MLHAISLKKYIWFPDTSNINNRQCSGKKYDIFVKSLNSEKLNVNCHTKDSYRRLFYDSGFNYYRKKHKMPH